MDNDDKLTGERTGKIRRVIRYTVAVSASILLVFIVIAGYNFYALSPERLYAEKYEPYIPLIDSGSSKIEKAYGQKEYGKVIKLNRDLLLTIKDIFLTGMAYLETKDYSRAVSSFQIVLADIKTDKAGLRDITEYYLALAYLQNRDYDQAIEIMNAIHGNLSHRYKSKFSRKFINRVKRLKWR